MKVEVCMGTNCMMNGSMELFDQLQSINELILQNPEAYSVESLEVEPRKCLKHCKKYDDYKHCTVLVDGHEVENMKGSELLEHVMNLIKK